MFILQTMRHAPESCPLGNSKNLDIVIQWFENLESLTAKYDIKVVDAWIDRAGHTSYVIFDASDREAFSNFEMDPQNIPIITINTIQKKVVTSIKETLPFFKEYKATKQQTP